jgi:hypothetical protein
MIYRSVIYFVLVWERERDLVARLLFFFLISSKLILTSANNAADSSGARLTPPVFFRVEGFGFLVTGIFISIIIRIN